MQQTGLIIKVSLALGGLMGTAYAHNWSAHLPKNVDGTSAKQVYAMTDAKTNDTTSLRPATGAVTEAPAFEDDMGTGATAPANTPDAADFPVIPNAAQEKVKNIFQGAKPDTSLLDAEGSGDHSTTRAAVSQIDNSAVGGDAAVARASLQNNGEMAAIELKTSTSPVPETSTSVGFGGMLALGVGLMAVRRLKVSAHR